MNWQILSWLIRGQESGSGSGICHGKSGGITGIHTGTKFPDGCVFAFKRLYRNPDFVEEETTIHIVTNRVNSRDEGQAIYEKVNSVVSKFLHGSLNYLGMIPQDAALERAVRQQKTVTMSDPNAKSARAISELADHLLNGTRQKTPVRWGIAQMFSSFLSNRK